MRIIATRDGTVGNYSFRVDSLALPDEIAVVLPTGKCLEFKNQPPRIIKYVKQSLLKRNQWKEEKMQWARDHYLGYLDETNLDKQTPLWKCIQWQAFVDHEHFGNDAFVWDFVNQREIRFAVTDPSTMFKHHQNRDECEKFAFQKNCRSLRLIEQALVTRIAEQGMRLVEIGAQ